MCHEVPILAQSKSRGAETRLGSSKEPGLGGAAPPMAPPPAHGELEEERMAVATLRLGELHSMGS